MSVITGKRYKTTVTCKHCGTGGFQWLKTPTGYRLFGTVPNGDGTVSIDDALIHSCMGAPASAQLPLGAVGVESDGTLVMEEAPTVEVPPSSATASPVEKARASKLLKESAPWYQALEALWAAGCRRALIAGPPGTGKTTTSVKILQTDYRVTMTEGTGVEDLLGCFQLRKENPSDPMPQTLWTDGPLVRAMREGKGVLIDEIDKMPPEIQSLMYAACDDHPEVMLPTGELVKAQAGYGVIATTNSNMAVLPEAIIDRMEAGLTACIPHPDSIAHLPVAERGAVVNYFKNISVDPWAWAGHPTVRRMRSFVGLVAAGTMTDDLVALAVFGKAGKEILSALTTAGRAVQNSGTKKLF